VTIGWLEFATPLGSESLTLNNAGDSKVKTPINAFARSRLVSISPYSFRASKLHLGQCQKSPDKTVTVHPLL
jgi:hypothetical protein